MLQLNPATHQAPERELAVATQQTSELVRLRSLLVALQQQAPKRESLLLQRSKLRSLSGFGACCNAVSFRAFRLRSVRACCCNAASSGACPAPKLACCNATSSGACSAPELACCNAASSGACPAPKLACCNAASSGACPALELACCNAASSGAFWLRSVSCSKNQRCKGINLLKQSRSFVDDAAAVPICYSTI